MTNVENIIGISSGDSSISIELSLLEGEVIYKGSNNEIVYTTTDSNIVQFKQDAFDAFVISNEMINGIGIIKFDKPITKIGTSAFFGKSTLKTISIPESVTTIGDTAFANCERMDTIIIPNSVQTIGTRAFEGCYTLNNITLPNNLKTIAWGAFSYCTHLVSITIPDSVTSIGDAAFCACDSLEAFYGKYAADYGNCLIKDNRIFAVKKGRKLESYNIPNGVTTIGTETFKNCTGLTDITIPKSVTTVETQAFVYCQKLSKIIIPENVTTIGREVFVDCKNLEEVECYPVNPPTASINSQTGKWNAFSRTSNLLKIYTPLESEDRYKMATGWSEYANLITSKVETY